MNIVGGAKGERIRQKHPRGQAKRCNITKTPYTPRISAEVLPIERWDVTWSKTMKRIALAALL